jgi:hypothetical protein
VAVPKAARSQRLTINPVIIAAHAKPLVISGVAIAAHCPSSSNDLDKARGMGKLNCSENIAGTRATIKTNRDWAFIANHHPAAQVTKAKRQRP